MGFYIMLRNGGINGQFFSLFQQALEENEQLRVEAAHTQSQLEVAMATQDTQRNVVESVNQQFGERLKDLLSLHNELTQLLSTWGRDGVAVRTVASTNMEAVGEQMMARIMASGGILGEEDRRRSSVGANLGRITPLGRISEDDEDRSPLPKKDDAGLVVSEDKMVVIKDGKVIEIESGQVILDGQKVMDLEEGKLVELPDGKLVGLEGGKLLEFEGSNFVEAVPPDKFPISDRYVIGEEKFPYRQNSVKRVGFADEQFSAGAEWYKREEEEGYDNVTLCKEAAYNSAPYGSGRPHHHPSGMTEYDQLPFMRGSAGQVLHYNPPPNFGGYENHRSSDNGYPPEGGYPLPPSFQYMQRSQQ